MGYPVVHFEITGTDGKKLHEYYRELFGWPIDADNEMGYGIIDKEANGGEGIGGGIATGPEGYPGHVTFYVAVPDVEESLAKAESLGGTPHDGPDGGHAEPDHRAVHRSRGPRGRRDERGRPLTYG